MRILLIEDDELLGDGVRTGLEQEGFVIEWLKDGLAIEKVIVKEEFDLIILDLGLPGISGLEILERVRDAGIVVPVLILTARETVEDRVKGLDTGADDYLTKPFDLDELNARIRALLRRSASGRNEPQITYADIFLDATSHTVTRNGELIPLSRREFTLLQKLLENPGRVLSREILTQCLYGWEEDVDSNALEVHVHNIRKKLDGGKFIRTIRGIGYMVEKEV